MENLWVFGLKTPGMKGSGRKLQQRQVPAYSTDSVAELSVPGGCAVRMASHELGPLSDPHKVRL